MKSVLFAATAATCCFAAPAWAQDVAAEQAEDGGVIIVLGQGLPPTPSTPAYAVIDLTREQITATGSGRLEDALGNVAGFQQFRRSDSRSANPSAQGITLRALGGNASSRAQMLLDGVPLADPFFGYIPFSAVAPERLSSIRVTRGGGSGPFGAGALAGTVELESADAAMLGRFSGQALVNGREETELSATFAPEVGEGFAVLSGRWDRGKGFFTTPESQRVPATSRAQYDAWSVGARFVHPVAQGLELQLRGLAFEDKRVLRFDGADNSSAGKDISARLVSRGPWQMDALVYGQWRNFTNVVINATQFTRALDQKDTPSEGLGGKLEVRPPLGADHVLRLGADYRRAEGNLLEDAYNAFTGARTQQRFAGGVNTDLGLFAEHDWTIGPVILTGGLRADRYRITGGYYRAINAAGALVRDDQFATQADWEFSYRAGALVQAAESLRLRAAAYSGLRLPTLNELYRPFVVFPVVTNANADLRPERLEGFEAGADWNPAPGFELSLTAFDNRVKDAIANVTIAPNLRQRRNLDAIKAQGLELAGAAQFGQIGFSGTLAYTDAQVVGTGFAAPLDGNRPSQTPNLAASGTLSWRPVADALLALTLRHVGAQFEGDQENDVLPAATTVDLFARLPLRGGFSLIARGENLLDETIITRNQGGSIDVGVPRTLWLGLRYGF